MANNGCVELARLAEGTAGARDSKLQDSPVIRFSAGEFRRFLRATKMGVFDI